MSLSQLRILLPWQSLKASPRPANESPEGSFGPTDESESSASQADTAPNIRHQPDQSPEIKPEEPPLATAQAAERSETMPPSKSHKEGKIHSQLSTNSRAKNRSRTASKPSSPLNAIPQSPLASNKYPSTSGKGSKSQDSSKPSSPAGKVFSPSQDASSKPSSPATVAATAPRIASKASSSSSQASNKKHPSSKPTSKLRFKADSQPSSPSRSAFPSQDPSMPPQSLSQEKSRQQASEKSSRVQSPSHFSRKPTTQSTSKQPVESPATIGIQSHPNSKAPSQSRFKTDSQPSPSSRSTFPSQDFSMPPRSPSHENSRQQPSDKTSGVQSPSHSSRKPTAQSTSKQPIESPATIGIQHHPNLKPSSQSRFKAESRPSSSSKSKFPSQDSSMPPRSPSQENSLQPPSEKTSRVQSPSNLSRKPTAPSTSQQPIESTASIGDQTTDGILSDPATPSPKAIPTSGEIQIQAKSKKSPEPNVKPVELKASKNQNDTKEELTSKNETKEELASKNTSNPHSDEDSSENPTQSDETVERGLDSSLESQTESKETKEDGGKTTNALQAKASRSTLITSSKSRSSFEPEKNTQQDESMEDLSKAFNKLNIKYSDEENPKSFTTMIGDNKGSSVHLLSGEAKSESSIHVNHRYKSNPDQSPKSSTNIKENSNNETPQDSTTEENPDPPPLELYINHNVQGINNSIMFNTSFTENNPGIKLKFPGDGEPTNSQDELESHHTRKSTYIPTPAEKVTYEPRIRRRYLGGLLMESGDSEDENPRKLRCHGCRYSRSSKGKKVETL
ncbi:flocculation protein FLO11 [Cucumis melo var. makuwa]|uniref:Flocculation protein FLO11 n=1 Tax=Cucumis melo var. makuwa TaxID=1194695 RepID=A0A5A7VAN0_CUCMM|nr:flocculation protein FLO11 [Cucumis melo var. makuwa]